jgi:glycosyltransferase involved in cell wall biosynthesis
MKNKILFVIHSLAGGGAERIMSLLLKYINREIFEPSLVLLNKEGIDLNEIPQDVTILDLNKKGRMDFFRSVVQLAKYIVREAPSLIVSFLTYTNYMTLLSRFLSRKHIPVVLSERNTLSIALRHEKCYPIKSILVKHLYPHAARIIAVSKGVKNDLLNFLYPHSGKVSVVYNAIDIAAIERLKQEEVDHPWFQNDIPILMACGRLAFQKNYPLLLKALAKVLKNIKAKLIILGEGEVKASLENLVNELGIQDNVIFLGFQRNPYKYMEKSHLFILSSAWEGFSNVLIEAMACGLPVISTRCPSGPDEIITNEVDGIMVPVGDVDALATAIMRLLNDVQLRERFIEAGRKRVDDFKLEKMIQAYEQVFLEEIESRGE